MAGNTIGKLFQVTTFGESHGELIGVVIDGCPAGLDLDLAFIQAELGRRRPGQSKITTQRRERDEVRFVSGIYEGKTTGTPLTALIKNEDQRSQDYADIAKTFRPSHADFTYEKKYGLRDPRGGGRSSARETAARVVAGAVAKLFLKKHGIKIAAYVSQVGSISLDKAPSEVNLKAIEKSIVRCPDPKTANEMISLIESVRASGDTIGGVVTAVIRGCPIGLGEPAFDKLHADLGKGMLSINAVKGFEYGSGFAGVEMRGSEHNDVFVMTSKGRAIKTSTNFSGGIQGGISNGMDIEFRVAFKPVATIMKSQKTVDRKGKAVTIKGKGRHDPCVVPRAVPIVEAMAAIVLIDHLLRNRATK
ncbi:chorismate synthase [Bdellovibrionota bacterium FG-2]